MAVMGPGDRKEEAQEAWSDIACILREKYRIEIETPEDFGLFQKQYNKSVADLKIALEEVFKLESYNSF